MVIEGNQRCWGEQLTVSRTSARTIKGSAGDFITLTIDGVFSSEAAKTAGCIRVKDDYVLIISKKKSGTKETKRRKKYRSKYLLLLLPWSFVK